jgi:hypothetical protein
MAEADVVAKLLEKIRICDAALANLLSRGDADRSRIERAIREVRAEAVSELRALGREVGDSPPA